MDKIVLDIISSFIHSAAHKYGIEENASLSIETDFMALTYTTPLIHPWPREFSYIHEIFIVGSDAEWVIPAINDYLPSRSTEYLLYVFSDQGDERGAIFEDSGYAHAWSNVLLGRQLDQEEHVLSEDIIVYPVTSSSGVDAANSLEPENLTSAKSIGDPYLHDFIAEYRSILAAKGQVVTVSSPTAYISDMFTKPQMRRNGIGSALLMELHNSAYLCGAENVILVPSRMTREFGFYEKHGYKEIIPMHLFIRDKSNLNDNC